MLSDCGSQGLEEGDGWIKVYFSNTDAKRLHLCIDHVLTELACSGMNISDPVFRRVEMEDWASGWREHFQPVQITDRISVVPPWTDEAENGSSMIIRIMPRMAFGTGTHETTRLMIALMESIVRPGVSVLDIGTGSGILAIVAVKLGAGDVAACDTDPLALQNASENLRLNDIGGDVRLWCGPLEASRQVRHDVILANIERATLVDLLPEMDRRIKPGGHVLLSGLLTEERQPFEADLDAAGYRISKVRNLGEWTAYRLSPASG